MKSSVTIDYHRLPNRVQRFEQTLVLQTTEFIVTYLEEAQLDRPLLAGGRAILEPGAPVVWFTYPDEWHDVGRFHLADGRFTGVYANMLTPMRIHGSRWETTDLCLDIWLAPGGTVELLDEEELAEAVARGWIDEATAARARRQAARLIQESEVGAWPPPHVHEWTLERVLERLAYSSGSST